MANPAHQGILLEVVRTSTGSLILVSFAAYRVDDVVAEIAAAAGRGEDVRLVLEGSKAEGGSLRFGAAKAFDDLAVRSLSTSGPGGTERYSKLEGLNSKIRLINHRGYGHHSVAALIGVIYLCAGGITIDLPLR